MILLLCVCGGLYFYTQWDLKRFNASLPSPPTHPVSEADASHEQGDSLTEAETATSVVESVQPSVSDASDASLVPEAETSDALLETAAGGEDTSSVEEPEKFYYGDYTMEELTEIRDWGRELLTRLQAKYPELAEITKMTPEEIAERYPTEKDRENLAKLGQEFLNEYLEETYTFLSVLPQELRNQAISRIHNQLRKNWGSQAADQAMSRFADLVRN